MPPKPPTRRAPARRTQNDGESNTGEGAESSTRTTTRGGGTAGSPPRTRTTQSTATPTPTPTASGSSAPTTTRPPVQRLQSLKKRPQGGTLIPPNPDGTTPKPTLKYQPRAVARRSKEEREARERVEAARQRERAAEAAAIQKASERGGGERGRGRGRGRGVGFGRGGGVNAGGMDGPSYRGAENRTRGGGFGGGFGGGGGGGGGMKMKKEYDGSGRQKTTKTSVIRSRDGTQQVISRDVSSDEGEDSGPRVSIENINAISDSEDESDEPYDGKGKDKGKQRAGKDTGAAKGLRPVRVERHEHVERVVAVNTEEDSSRSAELRRKAQEEAGDDDSDLFVRDDDEPTAQAEAGGTRPASAEPQVKEEPTDGDVVMTDDIPHARDVEPAATGDRVPSLPKEPTPKEADTKKQRRHGEDDLEWETQQREVDILKKTLGSIDLQPKPATDEEGQEPKSETEQPAVNPRDGRLFLIQFPPKTPNLIIPKDLTQEDDSPEAPLQPTAASPPAAATGIKKEESSNTDTPKLTPTEEGKPSTYVTAQNTNLPAGRVGKLNVHKSGRVTLDWGGIPFELNMGTEVDFLQDAVVTSSPSTDLTKDQAEEKKVWAMSQVTGKFVVTPDWDKLLDE